MTASEPCPFCQTVRMSDPQIVAKSFLGYAKWDSVPASPGHALVIPKFHITSIFGLDPGIALDLHMLLSRAKAIIEERFHPDGYTLGINDDPIGGQTVPHLHIHIIPRYKGDMPDPRGGIRRMFPDDPYIRQLGASGT